MSEQTKPSKSLNVCISCKWLDGFTGECIVDIDLMFFEHNIYKDPCPNPIYFVCGEGHCIDQHDLWRDSEFHRENLRKYNIWKKEAKIHKEVVEKQIKNYEKIIECMESDLE